MNIYNANLFTPTVTTLSKTITGSYTLLLSDFNKTIIKSGSDATVITIPTNDSSAFTIGSTLTVINLGTGSVRFTTASTAVNLYTNNPDTLVMNGQYSIAGVTKIDTNHWVLSGRLQYV